MQIKNPLIFILMFLVSLSFVVGQDWQTYGNIYTPFTNAQFKNDIGRFDLNYSSVSNANALARYPYVSDSTNNYQPIVSTLGERVDRYYIIIANHTAISVYDSSLTAKGVQQTGIVRSNLVATDFNNDGKREIAGWFNSTSNLLQYQVYQYNTTLETFIGKIYEANFSYNPTSVQGIRCGSNACYSVISVKSGSVFNNTFIIINDSSAGYSEIPLRPTTSTIQEPVSFADFNGDGIIEFFVYSRDKLLWFFANGSIWRDVNVTSGDYTQNGLMNAKMYRDSSNFYKVAYQLQYYGLYGGLYTNPLIVASYNPQTSTGVWTDIIQRIGTGWVTAGGIAISDYNNDNIDDVFTFYLNHNVITTSQNIKIYRGTDGAVLKNKLVSPLFNSDISTINTRQVVTAYLNNTDDVPMMLVNDGQDFALINPLTPANAFSNYTIYSNTAGVLSCVPADINLDNYQEIICSGTSGSQGLTIYSNPDANQRPVINSVSFSPSQVVMPNQTITATISASDFEGNTIFYSQRCFVDDTWSVESLNPIQTPCPYFFNGIYNYTAKVRDAQHLTYNFLSYDIYVNSQGYICNSNLTCDTNFGENNGNCPQDCPNIPANQTTSNNTQAEGGMLIPTQLVDVNNENQGLLPSIYFGFLGFLSYSLAPIMTLVFTIFLVLFILLIATLIKRVAERVVS